MNICCPLPHSGFPGLNDLYQIEKACPPTLWKLTVFHSRYPRRTHLLTCLQLLSILLSPMPGRVQAIDPFVANPDFEAKQIEKASKACTAICLWVRAMHKYNTVAKQVEPKRKLLAEKQVITTDRSKCTFGDGTTRNCRKQHVFCYS